MTTCEHGFIDSISCSWCKEKAAIESLDRCEVVAPATEILPETRCERHRGHEGAHRAVAGSNALRMWDSVTFPINFDPPVEKK